jgi:hypothetical protein
MSHSGPVEIVGTLLGRQRRSGNLSNTLDFFLGINTAGTIAGPYVDSSYVFHGYLRKP